MLRLTKDQALISISTKVFSSDRTLEHFSLGKTLVLFRSDLNKMLVKKQMKYSDFIGPCITGNRSTFEFPSRVNLSGPNLYCIARTLVSKADTQ